MVVIKSPFVALCRLGKCFCCINLRIASTKSQNNVSIIKRHSPKFWSLLFVGTENLSLWWKHKGKQLWITERTNKDKMALCQLTTSVFSTRTLNKHHTFLFCLSWDACFFCGDLIGIDRSVDHPTANRCALWILNHSIARWNHARAQVHTFSSNAQHFVLFLCFSAFFQLLLFLFLSIHKYSNAHFNGMNAPITLCR